MGTRTCSWSRGRNTIRTRPGNCLNNGGQSEFGGLGGLEVNFLPECTALHDSGYVISTYDLRNHGISGQGNGGIGLTEYRDVIGVSLGYAAACPGLSGRQAAVTAWSRCG